MRDRPISGRYRRALDSSLHSVDRSLALALGMVYAIPVVRLKSQS
jgi:hypothetical protein